MRALGGAVVAVVALSACGGSSNNSTPAPRAVADHIQLSSPAFAAGTAIPATYTCDGRDVSPPLRWSGIPAGAMELALAMRDRDAPGGTFLHWSLSRLPAGATGLATGEVPAGAVQGRNDFKQIGYGGPCPPSGDKPHHYVITLSALSGDRVVATGTLIGTYARR